MSALRLSENWGRPPPKFPSKNIGKNKVKFRVNIININLIRRDFNRNKKLKFF